MGFMVNRGRRLRAWRRGLLVGLAAALLAACGVVGIRPEDFEDAALLNGRRSEGLTFPATVEVLESLGADKYAYFHLAGPRATARELEELAADAGTGDVPGSDQVVARLDPASRAREGQPVQLWFDPGKLHLFNPDDGAHLTR